MVWTIVCVICVAAAVYPTVGVFVGVLAGAPVGYLVGALDGARVGARVGAEVGAEVPEPEPEPEPERLGRGFGALEPEAITAVHRRRRAVVLETIAMMFSFHSPTTLSKMILVILVGF